MKLRIKFSKYGTMKFIGHLDTMRYFQKLIRRADIPVAYSEGFSPHQKLSFAQPLGVGTQSFGEYFDMEVKDELSAGLSSKEVIKRLNESTAPGIEVTDCVALPEKAKNAMASVFASDYHISFRDGYECPFNLKKAVDEINAADSFTVLKETKKTSKELDLKELIYELKIQDDGLFVRLSSSSASSVKPSLFMGELYKKMGYVLPQNALLVTRLEIYDDKMMPLIDSGIKF